MRDILDEIARLTERRALLYQRRDWTDADRDALASLNEQIELLWRQRRAELAGADVRAVPARLPDVRFGHRRGS